MKAFIALGALLGIFALITSAQAQILTNIAPTGTAIFGYNTGGAALTTLGTPLDHAGSSAAINDNNLGDSDDTYGNAGAYGYVGIINLTVTPGDAVRSLNLYMSLFVDGGWFGTSGLFPQGAGSTLTASNLTPNDFQVQITTNNGVSWSSVGFTTDYVTALDGAFASNASLAPEAVFTLTNPPADLDGIRIIGTNGGVADGGGPGFPGFIGVHELQVEAGAIPEPSTWALLLGGLALLGFQARRQRILWIRQALRV